MKIPTARITTHSGSSELIVNMVPLHMDLCEPIASATFWPRTTPFLCFLCTPWECVALLFSHCSNTTTITFAKP